jgi:hypothetical protein
MNTITTVILVAMLALGSGCAKSDWIQHTLVTVDVTGVWVGSVARGVPSPEVRLELDQRGPKVVGYLRTPGTRGTHYQLDDGPIDGTVSGDVFRFAVTNEPTVGEMTVSGDTMKGYVARASRLPIILQRIDSSAPPRSQ